MNLIIFFDSKLPNSTNWKEGGGLKIVCNVIWKCSFKEDLNKNYYQILGICYYL